MAEHTFQALADRLRENGLNRLIPLKPRDKAPRNAGWDRFNDEPVPQDIHDRWVRRGAIDGVGCCCGGELFGLDLDHKEYGLAMAVRTVADEICGPSPVWRVGQPYKSMRFYRQDEPIPTQAPPHINAASYGTTGQFVLHHPMHPVTGKPYVYPDGETLMDVPVAELPTITAAQVDEFFRELRELIPPPDPVFMRTGGGSLGVVGSAREQWEDLRDAGWELPDAVDKIMREAKDRHGTMTGLVAFLLSAGRSDDEVIELIGPAYLSHFQGREIVVRYHKLERSIEGAHIKDLSADVNHLLRFGSWGRG